MTPGKSGFSLWSHSNHRLLRLSQHVGGSQQGWVGVEVGRVGRAWKGLSATSNLCILLRATTSHLKLHV